MSATLIPKSARGANTVITRRRVMGSLLRTSLAGALGVQLLSATRVGAQDIAPGRLPANPPGSPPSSPSPIDYPVVRAGAPFQFPRDHGAHLPYRTEWWYVTGWLSGVGAEPCGFQITFFRNRPRVNERSASPFAPRQLIFAHAALALPSEGKLLHDQRSARAGLGLAEASAATTALRLLDWSFALDGTSHGVYRAHIPAREFSLDLDLRAIDAPWLQGDGGYSRKGVRPEQASYYYSRPNLAVSGTITRKGVVSSVTGTAWLDHEWSSESLAPDAVGWDWVGLHFDDGATLMAYRIRRADGGVIWAGGSFRRGAAASAKPFAPDQVAFAATRWWRSPRTGARYPVATQIVVKSAAGATLLDVELEPLMDDQEFDARTSVGTVYWEGAVRVRRAGTEVGRGYLELTGYLARLVL